MSSASLRRSGDNRLVGELSVRLLRGPADGKIIELDSPLDAELTIKVRRRLGFRIIESSAGSEPIESTHTRKTAELHRYRLVQREPPTMEWVGRVEP